MHMLPAFDCRLILETGLPTKLAHAMHRAQLSGGNSSSSDLLVGALAAAALHVSTWAPSCQQLAEAGALLPLAGVLSSAVQRPSWSIATEAAWNILELWPASRLLLGVQLQLKAAPAEGHASASVSRPGSRQDQAAGSRSGSAVDEAAEAAGGSARGSSPASGPQSLQHPPAAAAPAAAGTPSAGWQLLALSYTEEQQAQLLAAAIGPLYSRLAATAASQADQELANDLLVVAGLLARGTPLAAGAPLRHGLVAEAVQQAAVLADGQQPGLTHQTAGGWAGGGRWACI